MKHIGWNHQRHISAVQKEKRMLYTCLRFFSIYWHSSVHVVVKRAQRLVLHDLTCSQTTTYLFLWSQSGILISTLLPSTCPRLTNQYSKSPQTPKHQAPPTHPQHQKPPPQEAESDAPQSPPSTSPKTPPT